MTSAEGLPELSATRTSFCNEGNQGRDRGRTLRSSVRARAREAAADLASEAVGVMGHGTLENLAVTRHTRSIVCPTHPANAVVPAGSAASHRGRSIRTPFFALSVERPRRWS
jgi:hypothetical protein